MGRKKISPGKRDTKVPKTRGNGEKNIEKQYREKNLKKN